MPSDRPSKPTSARPSSPSKPPAGRSSAAPDALIGRVIHEKYKITALLARGGMGKVYKALQSPLDRVCAVKILTPPQNETGDGQFHKRFFLEASIGARLTHPNTVTIFDYGVADDGVYFIAMEYLEGKTLSKVLREEGPFNEERTTHVARQICRSLREAHTLGVVHRDLKPANVYLLQHGDESDVVKVLDFGLVKDVESDGEDLTQTGLFMGSPKYMSPEQVKGEHLDGRADVYALGVMMYEMLTGHVPYEKAKQLDTLLAHVHDPVPTLREKKADVEVSEAIEALVTRCLQKNPADRPNGMEDVLAALKIASGTTTFTRSAVDALRSSASFTPQPQVSMSLSGEIPAANPTSIVPVDQQKPSKAKFVVAAVAALALVVGVGIATRSPKGGAAQQPEAQSAAQKKVEAPVTPSAPAAATTQAPAAKPDEHFVELDSEPTGSRVRDESKTILCDKTPCKVRVDSSLTVIIEQDGYGDQKVKLAQNDSRHLVKLTKSAVWHPPAQAAKPAATAAAPPTNTAFKPDPYGSGPY
ncbi:MAG: serine/threonine protein kinase [Polyangiales bacterium]